LRTVVIVPEMSSRAYKVSKLFSKLVFPYLLEYGCTDVVDFGAGRYLLVTKRLVRLFKTVCVVETQNQINEILSRHERFIKEHGIQLMDFSEPSDKKYDAIICTNVLNVIPDPQERKVIIRKMESMLVKDGLLVIKVPGKCLTNVRRSNHWFRHGDGYAFPFKRKDHIIYATFRAGFTAEKLVKICAELLDFDRIFINNSKDVIISFRKKNGSYRATTLFMEKG